MKAFISSLSALAIALFVVGCAGESTTAPDPAADADPAAVMDPVADGDAPADPAADAPADPAADAPAEGEKAAE